MKVRLLAVPYDSGMRGVRMGAGPEFLIEQGITGALERDGHSITVEHIVLPDDFFPSEVSSAFELGRRLAQSVSAATSSGEFPLVLAGNCSSCLGTIGGIGSDDLGIIWFDAHADFNTPDTTLSGFFDGMALGTATGRCWKEAAATIPGFHPVDDQRVMLAGARDLDPGESAILASAAVKRVSAQEIEGGLYSRLQRWRHAGKDVYLHVDLDVLDSEEVRVNSYATEGGLTAKQLNRALLDIASSQKVRAAAFTAYDPSLDGDGRVAGITMRLAASLLSAVEASGASSRQSETNTPVPDAS